MSEKSKNIIIIILSVLLFISFVFNIMSFKPMMHPNMQRDIPNMNDMPRERNKQRFENQNNDNKQNVNDNNQDETKDN